MPNAIKYSTSAQTLALKKGNYWIGTGDVGKGPTSTTDYYNGITPPSGGYTIYLNKASGGPSIYTAANDSQLISLSNTIAGQTFATAAAALAWFATQTDKMVFNIDYPAVVTTGLVLNVDAGFTPSYPTTGTTWYDLSSSANNGTLTNGPTFSTLGGGSIVFDGVDDRVVVIDNQSIDFTTSESFTVCYWIYTTSKGTDTGYDAHVGKINGTGWVANLNWTPFGIGDYPQLRWWLNGIINVSYNTSKPYLNNWRFICMSVDRSNQNGYIFEDGVLVSSGSVGTPDVSNNGNLLIGSDVFASHFIGNFGIVLLYQKSLSSNEVLQNYNATKSRFGL